MTVRLSLDGIGKSWGERRLLRGIDLEVDDGELVVVLGPSGCGKTTLLRIVAGLERADAGRVVVDGRDVTSDRPGTRGVGMVFQHHALLPHLTVAENIAFARRRPRRRDDTDSARAFEAATVTGCADLLDRRPPTLSAGERQRVALARALAREPRIVLLDEPLSSLDPPVRVALRTDLATMLGRLGTAAVFVTHDHAEAFAIGSRIVVLADGVVQQSGTPDEVHDTPATLAVVDLLGPTRFNRLPVGPTPDGSFAVGPFRIDAPSRLTEVVTAVVRPSDLRLVPPDEGCAGVVVAVEPGDDRVLVTVSVDGTPLRVLVPRHLRPAPGGSVHLAVDPAAVRYFGTGHGRPVGGDA